MLIAKQSLVPEQETEAPVHVAVALQQAGQVFVPLVEPVHDPLTPAAQLELVALQVVPEQVSDVPFQQVAVQLDLGVMREASFWGWGTTPRSGAGAGAKIAASASSAAGSAGAARVGRAQKTRASTAIPKASLLFIANPP
ncbi:MAG TPA: hypothetical protein VF173_19310 [Thermoanaerobaculia bacterium]|nr:hypothetical protein [Thermoanaerobaculia bacterium]